MARVVKRLSARSVATLSKPGRHSDGDGLYLIVDKSGAKRWAFIFRWRGKLKEMGLGGLSRVSLSDAREAAQVARRQLQTGCNPIDARKLARSVAEHDETRFGAFAEALVADIITEFRNDKHKAQWSSSLRTYAAPLAHMPLDEITTDDVLAVLKPIWMTKAETAARVRGRLERIFDAARARGLRTGENPARWRGHLDALLPARQKLTRGHHAAMPYQKVPSFVARLRESGSMSARALEFCILTAARSGEVLGARWGELDDGLTTWTVPADRMKTARPHRSPLARDATALLETLCANRASDYVFPGQKLHKPLSGMSMAMLLRRLGENDVTVHGFRSAFRDWAAEETDYPREIAEAALAHVIGDATERAYRRGDALEKRRALMEDWADFNGRMTG